MEFSFDVGEVGDSKETFEYLNMISLKKFTNLENHLWSLQVRFRTAVLAVL